MFKLQKQLKIAPRLNSRELLELMTEDNSYAVISVGTYDRGVTDYQVYGKNATELPQKAHIYEIGSITKTFTGILGAKAVLDEMLTLDDEVGPYLGITHVPTPTFRNLLTHTAGFKKQYANSQMLRNVLTGRNFGTGISLDTMKNELLKHLPEIKDYPVSYSNFGMAVAGNAVAEAYGTDYFTLMNEFIQSRLGLENTRLSEKPAGDFDKYWSWKASDAYLPAGGLTSTMPDMMKFLVLNISDSAAELTLSHQPLKQVAYHSNLFNRLNIYIDSVGMAWLLDQHNDLIWHNGGTDYHNADIRFNKARQQGVVVLSNLNYAKAIPATVLAQQLMREMR